MARKDKRTYSDRKQYIVKAVQKRRKKIRLMAIAYKGGSCEICGYNRCAEALDFHHLDPAKKDFSISSKGYTRSWKKVHEELDKCIMLCANCHRETHAKLAASGGNTGMISGLNQGNPLQSKGNPELALRHEQGQLGQNPQDSAEAVLAHRRKGKCRDFTPATLPH